MKIDAFRFGSITIDGKKYGRDVYIYSDGSVEKRNKGLLMFGSHHIGREELADLSRTGKKPELIVVGRGKFCNARLADEAKEWAKEEKIELAEMSSDDAVEKVNNLTDTGSKKVAALIHITC